jgi:ribonuclease Z
MVKLKPILERHADEIKQMGFKGQFVFCFFSCIMCVLLLNYGYSSPIVLPAILSQLEKTRKPISFSTGVTLQPPSLSIRGRRIMILGDTCDPSAMVSLVEQDPEFQSVDLLVHESTGTVVPDAHERKQEDCQSESQVASKMRERGHSTSFMAGQFAHRVRATRLVLNHLGGKFPAPQAALCPSKAFPFFPSSSSSSSPPSPSSSTSAQTSTIEDQIAVKSVHAEVWKKFEEIEPGRRAKIVDELAWLRAVENDALHGWRTAARNRALLALPRTVNQSDTINHHPSSPPQPLVSVAHDFLQIKVPRPDSQS